MAEHKVGTREEWQAAREELAKLEAEHAELGRRATERRRELPWVQVHKQYEFDTEDGRKTLAELFDGRSSCWPTTSCTAPTTRSVPAPAAPPSPMRSRSRACT